MTAVESNPDGEFSGEMTTEPAIHHFYHLFADGNWWIPVHDHLDALERWGLLERLATFHVGFIGTPENIASAKAVLEPYDYISCAEVLVGWEQETLEPLWKFSQEHDGLVSYAHTKGAANFNPINDYWRRSMTYHNFITWQRAVNGLTSGCVIVGCHWISGAPSVIAGGTSGMFGGNFWWTRCEYLRQNCPPSNESRMHAEHWLGQLSEVMLLTVNDTICDLNPGGIGDVDPEWVNWSKHM